MVYIYSYKRNLDGTFERPVVDVIPPEVFKREVNYFVISQPDKCAEALRHVTTLCFLGTFDEATGKSEMLETPDLLLDLSVPYNQIVSLRGNNNG